MLFGCSTVDFKSYFWMWKMTRYYSENCRQWHFFGEKFFFSFARKKSSDKILSDRTSVHWWRLDAPTHLIPPFSTNAPFCVLLLFCAWFFKTFDFFILWRQKRSDDWLAGLTQGQSWDVDRILNLIQFHFMIYSYVVWTLLLNLKNFKSR